MAKPRSGGACGDSKNQGAFTNSVAQISANSPDNCNLLAADHRAICSELLPLVSGWEAIFLRQIISQFKLSSPQKRKLEVICKRHFPNQQGGDGDE